MFFITYVLRVFGCVGENWFANSRPLRSYSFLAHCTAYLYPSLPLAQFRAMPAIDTRLVLYSQRRVYCRLYHRYGERSGETRRSKDIGRDWKARDCVRGVAQNKQKVMREIERMWIRIGSIVLIRRFVKEEGKRRKVKPHTTPFRRTIEQHMRTKEWDREIAHTAIKNELRARSRSLIFRGSNAAILLWKSRSQREKPIMLPHTSSSSKILKSLKVFIRNERTICVENDDR